MSYSRIWIDVTDFLRWKGALTGFQHIQYNMAREYLASGRDVHFFVYNEGKRLFEEVAFDPETVARSGIIGDSSTASESRSLAGRRVLSALKRRTPARLKEAAKKVLGSSAPALGGAATTSGGAPFGEEDVVLVLGGIWHGTFAADMAAEKARTHFTFVHIVHDMIPVRVPGFVVEDLPAVFAAYKDTIFRIADGLIINSQSSKRDAELFMKERRIAVPPSKVFRIADEPGNEKPRKPDSVKPGEFILSVGTIEGRKNHMLLYYAYKQAMRDGVALPLLVMAGRDGWLTDDLRYMLTHDPDMKDKIILCGGVTNAELAWLFDNCLFTVWPSFYEGWGMPVAESMAHGKVCLSSDTSSMPEIAPQLVEYFSPYNAKECLDLMVKYLHEPTRQDKERRISNAYKVTTWRDMYVSISDFIDSL